MRTLLTVLISLTLAAAAVAQPRRVVRGGRFYGGAYYGGYAYGYPYGRYYPAPYYPAPYYAAPYYYPPYYHTPYYYGPYVYGYPYGYYAPIAPRVAVAIGPGVIVGGGWRTFSPR